MKHVVTFDFDGVLHEDPHYRTDFKTIDTSLIIMAQARGYSVVVTTCNDVWRVANALNSLGIHVYADDRMAYSTWQDRGSVVLVTNRKIPSDAYVDDRAVRAMFGQPPNKVLAEVERVAHATEVHA